ncbi:hypothetical protein PLANPX_2538 [Lacipirellula parvula]|uniref:Uncharacterized protein n=1 Tax=Lacipirellula parvula TaxID=2650471 RepID=A0A5K7XF18_9BACT|nr:hypothetical protein PLANPX_2538 [Lacipirellula parvula]
MNGANGQLLHRLAGVTSKLVVGVARRGTAALIRLRACANRQRLPIAIASNRNSYTDIAKI